MVIVTTHCIADLFIYTESDIRIPGLHDSQTTRYLSSSSDINIRQYFHQFNYSELTMPALTLDEWHEIQRCHILTYLGMGGSQIIPLLIKDGEEKKFEEYFSNKVEIQNYPILRLPNLRKQLTDSKRYYEKISLVIHPLTVEIRNYFSHRIDIYFVEEMKQIINTSFLENRSERVFRIFFPEFDAFMVHSSVVNRKGKAIFFLASDEGGKTTVAKQVPSSTVLGDDQVILRKQNGKIFAYSTPWGKIVNDPMSAPLGAFFLLEKSRAFEITPIKPRQVVEFLWNEHIYFTNTLSVELRLRTYNLLSEAVNNVPVFRLRTPLNEVDWDKIDACL